VVGPRNGHPDARSSRGNVATDRENFSSDVSISRGLVRRTWRGNDHDRHHEETPRCDS
jgi:hypothetical protein